MSAKDLGREGEGADARIAEWVDGGRTGRAGWPWALFLGGQPLVGE